ncbi:MAG: DUF3891 family protein, partial [Thermoanaerobaculia bacterium]|nr:DUF3891 family protein [Thermoanaerobaculia bacterium]
EDGLPRHPRRDELLFAVAEHDNGWRESDAAPRVDPESGHPLSFLTLPDELVRELWERGIERHRSRPWTAALILEHALRLHGGRRGDPAWSSWLDVQRERRRELLEEHALDPAELARDSAWLRLADRLSLAVSMDVEESWTEAGRHFEAEPGGVLRIDPLPLAGATTLSLPVRHLPRRRFRGDADLGGELAAARWESARVAIRGA